MPDDIPKWPISRGKGEGLARKYKLTAGSKTSRSPEAQLDEALKMTFPARDPVTINTAIATTSGKHQISHACRRVPV